MLRVETLFMIETFRWAAAALHTCTPHIRGCIFADIWFLGRNLHSFIQCPIIHCSISMMPCRHLKTMKTDWLTSNSPKWVWLLAGDRLSVFWLGGVPFVSGYLATLKMTVKAIYWSCYGDFTFYHNFQAFQSHRDISITKTSSKLERFKVLRDWPNSLFLAKCTDALGSIVFC
mgnify:CR=1 FL=1